jgi:hypothetical protein
MPTLLRTKLFLNKTQTDKTCTWACHSRSKMRPGSRGTVIEEACLRASLSSTTPPTSSDRLRTLTLALLPAACPTATAAPAFLFRAQLIRLVGWPAAIGIHLDAAAEWRRCHSAEVNRLTVSLRALVSTSVQ